MRLMVYSHDTFGLGNIRRMLAICNHLHKAVEGLSILIVSGSPMLQSFRVAAGIDYVKLPCLKRSETGELGVKFLPMPADEIIRLRRELLLATVVSFQPDIVLVDKKPDGLAGELEPALRHIRCALPQTVVSLVLRDILDSPKTTIEEWTRRGYHNILHWYYDNILVLGSRHIFDVCAEYKIPAALCRKVAYCGYVAREEALQDRRTTRARLGIGGEAALILATTGGGEDGFTVLLRSIQAAHKLGTTQNLHTLVVTGPELPIAQRDKLLLAAANSAVVTVVEFLPDMLSHMHAADVVVSMGGYNTVCELATLNKRAVLVPRARPVQEQSIRLERMAGYGRFITLSPVNLESEALGEAIQTQLQRQHEPACAEWGLDLGALPRISRFFDRHRARRGCAAPQPFTLEHLALRGDDDLADAVTR
jgi:predicted glycosyltransferase